MSTKIRKVIGITFIVFSGLLGIFFIMLVATGVGNLIGAVEINDVGDPVLVGNYSNIVTIFLLLYLFISTVFLLFGVDKLFNAVFSDFSSKIKAYYYRLLYKYITSKKYRDIMKEFGVTGLRDIFTLRKFDKWFNGVNTRAEELTDYNANVYFHATGKIPDMNEDEFHRINDILISTGLVEREDSYPYKIINNFGILFYILYIIDEFDVPKVLSPEPELLELYRSINDGLEFENFIAMLLSEIGYADVQVTKSSGDQGIDVLATLNNTVYAIQTKLYSDKVNNSAIQQAVAGKNHYNAHVAVVATNSSFTPSAIELALSNNVLLWDGLEVERMIARANQ